METKCKIISVEIKPKKFKNNPYIEKEYVRQDFMLNNYLKTMSWEI